MPEPSPTLEAPGWGRATRHPFLLLLLLVAVQTVPTLSSRDYWAFDEVRHAEALREVREGGHWFSLHLNGQPYPDKPPVYFWLATLAATLTGTDGPPAFFLVSALGGFLFLAATWWLARVTLAQDRPELALAAALLVSVTPLFQLLLRTTRMDLLFAALIVASTACVWRGIRGAASSGWTIAGLGLAGLAALVKGPAGFVLPVATLLVYLAWTGRMRRCLQRDVVAGLLAGGGLIAAWGVGLAWIEGWAYVGDLLSGQVVGRTLRDHKHAQGAWFYVAVLPAAWLPWSTLLATVPWSRVLAPATWRGAWTTRWGPDPRGAAFLGVAFATAFVLLSLATSKLFIYLMPLLGPLAVATAVWIAGLGEPAHRRFARLTGAGLLAAAIALPFAERWQPFEEVHLRGLVPTAALLGATGLAVLLRPRRALALSVVGLTCVYLLVALWLAPSFDPVMSPRRQAEALARLADRGYAPLVYKVYPGTYSYYARRHLLETREEAQLEDHLTRNPRTAVATARKYWERRSALFVDFALVDEQRIEGQPFVLLARPAPGEEPPR